MGNEISAFPAQNEEDFEKTMKAISSLALKNDSGRRVSISCRYQMICEKYVRSLNIGASFFNSEYDFCYCQNCHTNRGDGPCYRRGIPAKVYKLPLGWYRFGLKVSPRTSDLKIFEKWHRAFHGTEPHNIKAILQEGLLLIPGDMTRNRTRVCEGKGHFNKTWKPKGFNTKQIFLSPSIQYAGNSIYSKVYRHHDAVTNKNYQVRVVLQVCIEPGNYQVGPETIGATSRIDPHFNNSEIEWSTEVRGSIEPYGLLVKLEEIRDGRSSG